MPMPLAAAMQTRPPSALVGSSGIGEAEADRDLHDPGDGYAILSGGQEAPALHRQACGSVQQAMAAAGVHGHLFRLTGGGHRDPEDHPALQAQPPGPPRVAGGGVGQARALETGGLALAGGLARSRGGLSGVWLAGGAAMALGGPGRG